MINLDERFHSYLHTDKCFVIDGACEKVKGYGFDNISVINHEENLSSVEPSHSLVFNLKEEANIKIGIPKSIFIDIDSEFKKDFNISFSEGFSVQAIRRKELGWSNFYAGLVFVRMDEVGKSFIENMYKMINDSLHKNTFHWGIDQSCLDMCYEKKLLDSFDKNYMDFTHDSDASFISYKGYEKWNQ